jgi:hypothetical protein
MNDQLPPTRSADSRADSRRAPRAASDRVELESMA